MKSPCVRAGAFADCLRKLDDGKILQSSLPINSPDLTKITAEVHQSHNEEDHLLPGPIIKAHWGVAA